MVPHQFFNIFDCVLKLLLLYLWGSAFVYLQEGVDPLETGRLIAFVLNKADLEQVPYFLFQFSSLVEAVSGGLYLLNNIHI